MKRVILLALFAMAATASQAQVYKMDRVWNLSNDQFLFCKKDFSGSGEYRFILCDTKYYDKDNNNPFISVYFEGSAMEMESFLSSIMSFLELYGDEKDIMTEIHGRMIYRVNIAWGRGVYIFEEDGRHFGGYRDRQLKNIYDSLIDYCKKENIRIE